MNEVNPPIDPLCFDEDGFLQNPAQWSDQIAEQIALCDGIGPLTNAHWDVIHYIRAHYFQSGALPITQHVCRVTRQGRWCIEELFRSKREVWRIAGLPNPGEEAKTYM